MIEIAWDQMGAIEFLLDLEKLPNPIEYQKPSHRKFASFSRTERLRIFRVSRNGIWRIRNEFLHLI